MIINKNQKRSKHLPELAGKLYVLTLTKMRHNTKQLAAHDYGGQPILLVIIVTISFGVQG
jgi:hypothetical protein